MTLMTEMTKLITQARKRLRKEWKKNNYGVGKSKINRYRSCRRRHFYAGILNLERIKKSQPLVRGSIIHELLESKNKGTSEKEVFEKVDKEYGRLFEEEKDYYGNLPEDIRKIWSAYKSWYKKDPLNFIAAEYEFRYPLCTGIDLTGTIDAIAKDRAKSCWLVEAKTRKSLPQDRSEYSAVESAIYTWVAPRLGFPKLKGICWDYIRAKAPVEPRLLKNGTLTKARIDTTWPVYKKAIEKHGLRLKDYLDVKHRLQGKENDFFERAYLPIDLPTRNRIMAEAKITAKEMRKIDKRFVDTGDQTIYVRSIERHCTWCDFEGLCKAELMGLDTDLMLKKEFKDSEYGKKEYKTQEAKGPSRLHKSNKKNKTSQ